MGSFRQQLIRLVACVVAIDLAAGVVAIAAHSDRLSTVNTGGRVENAAPPSAGSSAGASSARSGGVLASGSFTKRRRSLGQPTAPAATGSTGAPATLPSAGQPLSPRPPAVSNGGSSPSRTRAPTAPAAGQSATTATSGPSARSPGSPTMSAPDQPAAGQETGAPAGAAPANAPTTPTSGPPKGTTPSSTSGVWTVVDDATGDTVVDSTHAPQANPRADVVQSRGANTTKGVGLAVKVAQPGDPTKDPTWASDATFVLWEVDTSGDGKPDFQVEYFVDSGKLFAGVDRVTPTGTQPACEAEAGYMNDNYIVGIDPGCLGSPASFSYRATFYYATDPSTQNGESISDVSPDGGLSPAIRRVAA